MARRNSESAFGTDKAKVRVFFAEVEGNNESVQEALKTMVSAMSRPVRVISELRSNGGAALLTQEAGAEELDEAIEQPQVTEDPDDYSAASSARKTRGTGKKIDRNAGIELVPDMDFRPSGKQTFKDFLEEKNPANDLETVLVAVYYLRHLMVITKVGPDHVMTAFKEAGKAIPVDLKQTIRNIKKSKAWLNFTDIKDVRTTTQGDNFVEHNLGKSE